MKDLIILGTGVHAAEMAEIVARVNAVKPTWNLRGYLAPPSHAEQVGSEINGVSVLGTPEAAADHPHAACVPAFGAGDWIDTLQERWTSLVDPSAFVSRTAQLGAGCVIYPNCFIGMNARLADRVFSLAGSIINHDVVLEDRVSLCSGVTLAGHVHVEPDAYLGQACTVRQFLRVGASSLIGMGAVVVADVPPHSVMAGNPARRVRARAEGQ